MGYTQSTKKEHTKTIRSIMRNLVRRYVTVEQRKSDNQGVTEDDVNEIKQDISAFRCELIEVLKNSGMNTSTATGVGQGGKKNRQKERRLMKGFNLATVGGGGAAGGGITGSQSALACSTPSLAGSTMIPTSAAACSRASMQTLNETSPLPAGVGKSSNPLLRSPITKLAQLARLAGAKKADSKRKWGNLIEAAKSARGVGRMWARSRSRSEDSVSSDGSGHQGDPDTMSRSGGSQKSKTKTCRTGGYSMGVVHVTENELPEVLEESGIDYELTSGRLSGCRLHGQIDPPDSISSSAVNSTTAIRSPTANLRRFRRAVSEPVQNQVTLVLENKFSLPLMDPAPLAEEQSGTISPESGGVIQRPDRSSYAVIPPCSPSRRTAAGGWGRVALPDGLPYMDDSSDPASESIPPPPCSTTSMYKSFNGAPSTTSPGTGTVSAAARDTAISGDAVHGIQPLGRHLSGGGWL